MKESFETRVCDLLSIFKFEWLSSFRVSFTMNGNPQIQVLADCRYLLRFMNLGTNIQVQIRQWKIPNSLLFTLLLIPSSFGFVCEILNMFEINLDFYEDSHNFLLILATFQIQIMYLCLIYKNGIIIELLDHIQRIVERSKCPKKKIINCTFF